MNACISACIHTGIVCLDVCTVFVFVCNGLLCVPWLDLAVVNDQGSLVLCVRSQVRHYNTPRTTLALTYIAFL